MITIFSKETGLCVGNMSSSDYQLEENFKLQFSENDYYFYNEIISGDPGLMSYDGNTLSERSDKEEYLAGIKVAQDRHKLNELIRIKTKEAQTSFDNEVASIKEGYSQSEIDGWDIQRQEAEAYQIDNNANVPTIQAMVTASERDIQIVVDSILAKVATFQTAYGTALGKKKKMQLAVETIKNSEDPDIVKITALETLTF